MHDSMMNQFMHLSQKGIMWGTYTNGINETRSIEYFKRNLQYMRSVDCYKEGQEDQVAIGAEYEAIKPLPTYRDAATYNGIPINRLWIKVSFCSVGS